MVSELWTAVHTKGPKYFGSKPCSNRSTALIAYADHDQSRFYPDKNWFDEIGWSKDFSLPLNPPSILPIP
jgi:hypothetical protein